MKRDAMKRDAMKRNATKQLAPLWIALVAFLVHAWVGQTLPAATFVKYPVAAEMFANGTLDAEREIDFSPLYLGVHQLAHRLDVPSAALLWAQRALAAAVAGLLFVLLRRRGYLGVAFAATAIYILDRNVLVYTNILEPEILLLFLLAVLLVAIERPEPGWATVAGIAAALGLATRPNLLAVIVAVPVFLLLRSEAERPLWHRSRWARIAVFVLPVALAFVFLGWRSHRISGEITTPIMNPGTVFFEGNNPLSRGTSAVYPPLVIDLARQPTDEPDNAHRHYREVARATAGPHLTISEVNDHWRNLAVAFIRDEPGRWLALELGKLKLAFHNSPLHDVATAWLFDRTLRLPTVPFAALATLALLGALIEARRWRENVLLYALIFGQLLTMLVFYVSARQRVALVPALILFAAAALTNLRRPKAHGLPRGVSIVLGLLIGICLLLPNDILREEEHKKARGFEVLDDFETLRAAFAREPPTWHLDATADALGLQPWLVDTQRPAYLSQDEMPLQERIYQSVVAKGPPASPSAAFDRAFQALRAGQLDEAEAGFTALDAIGFHPYRLATPLSLEVFHAWVALTRADGKASAEHFRAALDESPGDPFALAWLAAFGDTESGAKLNRYWGPLEAQHQLGRVQLALERGDAALANLTAVAEALPERRGGMVDHAAALAVAGHLDEAVRTFLEAAGRSVDPVQRDPTIPDAVCAWAEDDRSPRRRLIAGRVLHQYGYLREALTWLEPIALQPDVPSDVAKEVSRTIALVRHALRDDRHPH